MLLHRLYCGTLDCNCHTARPCVLEGGAMKFSPIDWLITECYFTGLATDLRTSAESVAATGCRRSRRRQLRQRRATTWSKASRGGSRWLPNRRWPDWRSADADVARCTLSRLWTLASVCRRPSPTDDSTCSPSAVRNHSGRGFISRGTRGNAVPFVKVFKNVLWTALRTIFRPKIPYIAGFSV